MMRTSKSWYPDWAEPQPSPSPNTTTSSVDWLSPYAVRSDVPRQDPSLPDERQETQRWQPEERQERKAPTWPSEATRRSPFWTPSWRSSSRKREEQGGASSSQPRRENQTAAQEDDLGQSLWDGATPGERRPGSKTSTRGGGREDVPLKSDSETIRQLRREKEALELRNAKLEDD